MTLSKQKGAQAVRENYPGMRSGLIVSGLDERRLEKASSCDCDLVHIELEDGVLPNRKAESRRIIAAALTRYDWTDKLTLVRVNSVSSGFLEEDVAAVAEGLPTAFLLGKCDGPEDIRYLDKLVCKAEKHYGLPDGCIKLASMIERASALHTIDQIAAASSRMIGLYIGPTDLGAEVGYRRTYRGQELEVSWVRSRVVIAAHLAGLIAIDSPTPHYKDPEETAIQARWSYQLGFDVKTCVSPGQLEWVNRAFSPTEEDLRWAADVLEGRDEAALHGSSVWVKRGMMIDDAMIARATSIQKFVHKLAKD